VPPSAARSAAHAGIAANLAGFRRTSVPLDGRRAASVAIALAGEGDRLAVWLTRRTSRLRAHPGQWALPGGRHDEGEDALGAALRELREELGVAVGRDAHLGTLDDYPTRSGYVITPTVVWAGPAPVVRPNPAEVARVYSITMTDLDVEPRFLRIPESDRPVIQLPLLDSLIHAPTAAMLYQFREVGLHGRSTRVAHLEQPVFAWR
jgi:8-oxo-dGTP pyrophosphatase MutT (NUDIX family)